VGGGRSTPKGRNQCERGEKEINPKKESTVGKSELTGKGKTDASTGGKRGSYGNHRGGWGDGRRKRKKEEGIA